MSFISFYRTWSKSHNWKNNSEEYHSILEISTVILYRLLKCITLFADACGRKNVWANWLPSLCQHLCCWYRLKMHGCMQHWLPPAPDEQVHETQMKLHSWCKGVCSCRFSGFCVSPDTKPPELICLQCYTSSNSKMHNMTSC